MAILTLVFVAFLASSVRSQQTHRVLVRNNRGGLSKQYGEIFRFFRGASYLGVQSAFATFRLPPEWFTATYGPEIGPKLEAQYEQEFQKFETATEQMFGSGHGGGEELDIHSRKFDPGGSPDYKPSPPFVLPLPPVQYFDAQVGKKALTGDNGYGSEAVLQWRWWSQKSTNSFVYVDGAFRFLGLGTHPFWDSLDQQEASCSDSPPTRGRLTYRFPPPEVYATTGKKERVLGKVELDVTVRADGRVTKAEVVSGDPRLAEAARGEAMRWFYFPSFQKCGQPVEGVAREVVDFRGP